MFCPTDTICGPDVLDSTTIDEHLPPADFSTILNIRDVTIGIPKEYHHENLADEILEVWRNVVNMFQQAGASIKEVQKRTHICLKIIIPTHTNCHLLRTDFYASYCRLNRYVLRLESM